MYKRSLLSLTLTKRCTYLQDEIKPLIQYAKEYASRQGDDRLYQVNSR